MDNLHDKPTFDIGKWSKSNFRKNISKQVIKKQHLGIKCCVRNVRNLQTLQGYIFHILQHFAIKLCSFNNCTMFVMIDSFVFKYRLKSG